MGTLDIGMTQMAVLFGVVLLPWLWLNLLGLKLNQVIAVSLLRMTVQLGLVGFYLKTLFTLNDPWLNGLWIVVMLVVFKNQFPTGAATWLLVALVLFMAASIQFYARWRRLRAERLAQQSSLTSGEGGSGAAA